ncbi:hypothetical protein [Levilactobacillus brevis]|jgi:hypothetical protein|nr:hypothetical protein [Levilactobacillus brevis]
MNGAKLRKLIPNTMFLNMLMGCVTDLLADFCMAVTVLQHFLIKLVGG